MKQIPSKRIEEIRDELNKETKYTTENYWVIQGIINFLDEQFKEKEEVTRKVCCEKCRYDGSECECHNPAPQEKECKCEMKPWCARNIAKMEISPDPIYNTCTCSPDKQDSWEEGLEKWMTDFIDNGEDMDAWWQNNLKEFFCQTLSSAIAKEREEILKYVQEDIDFGAEHQQIVSTKAKSYILSSKIKNK